MSVAKQTFKLSVTSKPFNYSFAPLLGCGLASAIIYKYYQNSYNNTANQLKYVREQFERDQVYNLNSEEVRFFPWALQNNIEEWEGKVVKLKGYFNEDRFFVRRQKDGKDGYIVLAPMLTSVDYLPNSKQQENSKPIKNGIMVNLGWVPLENKNDISRDPPTDPYEFTDEDFDHIDSNFLISGHMRETLNTKMEDEIPMHEISGVLRRGEEQCYWNRRVNFQRNGNYNFIDLNFMARLFRFTNVNSASSAYIEYIAAEEVDEEVYPQPTTKQSFKI